MRKAIIFLFLVNLSVCVYCQGEALRDKLYKLEDRIIKGDIDALKQIANYIDDTSQVTEFLGWHVYSTTARSLALRTVRENCLLGFNEMRADTSLTSSIFLAILNSGKLQFDEISGMFLITALKERTTAYNLKELSAPDFKRIDSVLKKNYPGRFYKTRVKSFLQLKEPEALMWIASDWFKNRHRFSADYYYDDEQFLSMIRKLTHADVGVPDENGTITFLYDHDFYGRARLSYLVYWFNHWSDYKWNEREGYFENVKEKPVAQTREDILFPLLYSENDSIAMDAFLLLAEMDTARVKVLADDHEKKSSYGGNFNLPFRRFSFLKLMTKLTLYCRNNGIDYKPGGWMLASLEKLKDWDLKYAERYSMENEIINKLTPATVTMVEYFGLVNERDWTSGYSIGRILDKYYSKHWREVIAGESGLLLFLKKVKLFKYGASSNYLRKFENCSEELFKRITAIFNKTNDDDIRASAKKIMDNYDPSMQRKEVMITAWNDGQEFGVNDLHGEYEAILDKYTKKEDRVWPIKQLFSRINYSQLGEAVKILMADKNWGKYDDPLWIVKNDFGLDINSKSDSAVREFLEVYRSKTEQGVYKYYLTKKGINCFAENGDFIFEKVYEVLKFDVVNSFVSGSASREDGVYPLIRLLELKFGTRLGFCEKLCGSKGVYTCSCNDRARLWMKYLEDNGYVKVDKSEPASMSYRD